VRVITMSGTGRQVRAVRSRVLRGVAGDADPASGQVSVHPRRGVLRPPRPVSDEDALQDRLSARRKIDGGLAEVDLPDMAGLRVDGDCHVVRRDALVDADPGVEALDGG